MHICCANLLPSPSATALRVRLRRPLNQNDAQYPATLSRLTGAHEDVVERAPKIYARKRHPHKACDRGVHAAGYLAVEDALAREIREGREGAVSD